ncbi:hypothetical protein H109_07278 [Trichophyton interdigitale MR816]|uniref:Uncharacterized protein n=1 Tax=Trichophyton interdigitale (strain MR816) TaxID=1215338 RepID=A0A059IYT0_TRIIM|nr:hypothetical protein H109_07278 [Trichophyton interdigitale MR816]
MALLVNRIGEVACFIGHDDPGGRCKSWLLWFAHETTMTMTMMGDGDGDDGHGRLACLIRVYAQGGGRREARDEEQQQQQVPWTLWACGTPRKGEDEDVLEVGHTYRQRMRGRMTEV